MRKQLFISLRTLIWVILLCVLYSYAEAQLQMAPSHQKNEFSARAKLLTKLSQNQLNAKNIFKDVPNLDFISGYNINGTIYTGLNGSNGFFYLPYASAPNKYGYAYQLLNNIQAQKKPSLKANSFSEKYEMTNTKYFFKDEFLEAFVRNIVVTPARTTTTNYTGLFTYAADKNNYSNTRNQMKDDAQFYVAFKQDKLGNLRMIFTDVTQKDVYTNASLETNNLSTERLYYLRVDSARIEKRKVPGYQSLSKLDNGYIQKLNGDNTRIGSAMLLKVNSGDEVSASVNSWFTSSSADLLIDKSGQEDLVKILDENIKSPVTSEEKNTMTQRVVSSYLEERNKSGTLGLPSAYINMLFLDDSLQTVLTRDESNSNYQQVKTKDAPEILSIKNKTFVKSGYLLIFVSNETAGINVYFDNLQVTHTRKPMIEENVYPFSISMKRKASKESIGQEIKKSPSPNSLSFKSAVVVNTHQDVKTPPLPQSDKNAEMVITKKQFYYTNSKGDTVIYNNIQGERMTIVNNTSYAIDMIVDETYYNNKIEHKQFNFRENISKLASLAIANIEEETDVAIESDEVNDDIVSRYKNLILEFTGYAKDIFTSGKVRQQGLGSLNIYSAETSGKTILVASYEALSGAMQNGLLPNGTYVGLRPQVVNQFIDEQGFGFKMILKADDAIGMQNRGEFRIHPVQRLQYGKNVVQMPTEGCIGLSGGHSQVMVFFNTMMTYFRKHNVIQLHVNIKNNANITHQLGDRIHY